MVRTTDEATSGHRCTGTRVPRVEDTSPLTGTGTYLVIVVRPDLRRACLVRDPVARLRIAAVDVPEALPHEGVPDVSVARDLDPGVREQRYTVDGRDTRRPPLAESEVRFVGDYDDLPPVADHATALKAAGSGRSPQSDNLPGQSTGRPMADLDPVLGGTPLLVSVTVHQQSCAPEPMESRGIVAATRCGARTCRRRTPTGCLTTTSPRTRTNRLRRSPVTRPSGGSRDRTSPGDTISAAAPVTRVSRPLTPPRSRARRARRSASSAQGRSTSTRGRPCGNSLETTVVQPAVSAQPGDQVSPLSSPPDRIQTNPTMESRYLMPGRVEGKVAFITGAARGQGRSHAVRLAEEGADIIAVDVCKQLDGVTFRMSTPEDLEETVSQVQKLGRRIHAVQADVRDHDALKAAVDDGVAEFGRLDIVVANAGLGSTGATLDVMDEKTWRDMIDVNLTGVWLSTRVSTPHIVAGARGGSVILTSSVGGLKGYPNIGHYIAAKHGVVGLMRTMAEELGPHNIRVNTLHSTQVNTPMVMHEDTYRMFRPDLENPTADDFAAVSQSMHVLPTPWVESLDISNAVLFLASDESRFVTGVTLPIDAGALLK
ncbi:mycofactocin-coupled SDR family oxidoreductase [Streptomyces sp. NPDC058457]|uniref:mycofactocin-coupled SDR family oxidoreductase n=1 Tax=Streptomyces sp. NPDC058457 TaxID=3346507 RepID=UPI00364BD0B2